MTNLQTAVMVGIFALGTFVTRALPFWVFPPSRPTPKFVLYLGRVLPFAITAMLIVYCLKDIMPFSPPFALPEIFSIVVVAGCYLLVKNSLAAIAAGTVLYMVLVQFVFV